MSRPASEPRTGAIAPLYAAGFVTAFGAHSIAAGIGASSDDIGLDLLRLGALLAIYDLAEVFLKPVFGSIADRIGAKPVIVVGLLAFGLVSLVGLWSSSTVALAIARLGQGAAASAFSPASSATVARLAGAGSKGRYFGRYGSWKGLGYTLGPLIGAGLIFLGGFALLFACLSAVAIATAVWVAIALPGSSRCPAPATRSPTSHGRRPNGDSSFPRSSLRHPPARWALPSASSPHSRAARTLRCSRASRSPPRWRSPRRSPNRSPEDSATAAA
ncbi:MFS transporter [Microbacterium sp. Se5.02b]|uniref:MFS transporter n=1 Tax=Microbacterium sp. Se5.02b TaxID=2864103 RepID=UPI00215D9285|nr:MFS transporter [Microbacterium sp. Se5.02b]